MTTQAENTFLDDKVEDTSTFSLGARIAVYDNLLSSPRIIDIPASGLMELINRITKETYDLSHSMGGSLPFTVIQEIAENFIHAGFQECTVSILDNGNTLSFSDQGPGIAEKELSLRPGFTSATQEMKKYIRGVGSGLPIVREYLMTSNGNLIIEDNVNRGAVVTISSLPTTHDSPTALSVSSSMPEHHQTTSQEISSSPFNNHSQNPVSSSFPTRLSHREEAALKLFLENGILGSGDLAEPLRISAPTATRLMASLESKGLVENTINRKRILSNAGLAYLQSFQ